MSDGGLGRSRPRVSRPVLIAGAVALMVVATLVVIAVRGPRSTGLAGTGWDPPVILAVDPSSPQWEFQRLGYHGDGGPEIRDAGLQPPHKRYSLSYVGKSGSSEHGSLLELDVFEVATAEDRDSGNEPGAGADPRRSVEIRGRSAWAATEPEANLVSVEWWENDTTLARLSLRAVPSLAHLAAGEVLVQPTVDDTVAAADELVEISRQQWLDLDGLTQERSETAPGVEDTR